VRENLKLLIYAPIRWLNAETEYILIMCGKLKERGVEPVIMGSKGNPMLEEAKKAGLRTEDRFDLLNLNPLKLALTMPRLRRWMAREKFEVVDIHRSEGFAVLAGVAKSLNPRPALIRTRQDMRPVRTDPVNRWTYNSMDAIIVSNQLLAHDLAAKLRLDPQKFRVIYFGIDPEEFRPQVAPAEMRKRLNIDPSWRLVGLSARLAVVKGHEYFLKAAEIVSQEIPEIRFLVSYRKVEKESDFLERLAKSPAKDKFFVFGPGQDLPSLLNLCEVGVLSSVGSEASSRACLEWMALSKPVVATRVGTLPELVSSAENGYLLMPRDSSGLAGAIKTLLKNPDRAREMGARGRELFLEKFQQKIMLEKTLSIFREVTGKTSQ
jgi:glycosyltransferase involved in cell wall biosynthesis